MRCSQSGWQAFLFSISLPIQGVVRIHLLEADKLAAKDNYVKGVMSGMSDPYALIRVGPQTFRSRHKDNTDSPKWGEIYEVRHTHTRIYTVITHPVYTLLMPGANIMLLKHAITYFCYNKQKLILNL